MERVIVVPEGIRCLGNIVSPKSLPDYSGYICSVTAAEEQIGNVDYTTFSMDVDEFLIKTLQLVLKTDVVYTDISESNGALIATDKSIKGITSFDELDGAIVNMVADNDVLKYDIFSSSNDSEADYELLKTALVDFEYDNNEIKITTLGDL